MRLLSVLTHHSEPTDPVLLRWLTDTIDAVLGLPPVEGPIDATQVRKTPS